VDYLPAQYRNVPLVVGEITDLVQRVQQPSIIRNVKLVSRDWNLESQKLTLGFEGLVQTITVPGDRLMKFGSETISMIEYFRRTVERNDLLDFIIDPTLPDQVAYFWIHIEYIGEKSDTGKFSEKDDGLFALRAKAGEKAERLVVRKLVQDFGHSYPDEITRATGTFQIWYKGKKNRKPDRVCSCCGLAVEVKKRNKDRKYRISHSVHRPFQGENVPGGWHAFVFPDMGIHFVSNRHIYDLLKAGAYSEGADQYDAWVDLNQGLDETDPPVCNGSQLEH
jgi:hypothetical protein